jgi:outer membrane protein OmpA-like peptidoglycan-associated protein
LEKSTAQTGSCPAVPKPCARLSLACCLLLACASGAGLRQRADAIETDLQAARELRADTCAPKELATAEANLKSARLAMQQGDAGRAESLLQIASPAAREALEKSKQCKAAAASEKPAQAARPAPPPPVPAPAPTVALKDTDGDGVPDVDDLCPDAAGPADRHGCPVFTDRDADGVADDIDRCPELPGPKENFGCPWPDRDGDRVADKDDKCPDEPGSPENQGCPRKSTLIVVKRDRIELKQQIHFQPNRARILTDSYEVLDEVAEALKQAGNVTVRIEGHTDNVGKRSENLQLSQDRADAVKDYLVKQGVPAGQLKAVGYGQKRPIASNSSRAGRTANRRVEFRLEGSR